MRKKESIIYTVSEGAGIRPLANGINHILRNVDSEEELEIAKEHARNTTYACEDWDAFRNELLKQEYHE